MRAVNPLHNGGPIMHAIVLAFLLAYFINLAWENEDKED